MSGKQLLQKKLLVDIQYSFLYFLINQLLTSTFFPTLSAEFNSAFSTYPTSLSFITACCTFSIKIFIPSNGRSIIDAYNSNILSFFAARCAEYGSALSTFPAATDLNSAIATFPIIHMLPNNFTAIIDANQPQPIPSLATLGTEQVGALLTLPASISFVPTKPTPAHKTTFPGQLPAIIKTPHLHIPIVDAALRAEQKLALLALPAPTSLRPTVPAFAVVSAVPEHLAPVTDARDGQVPGVLAAVHTEQETAFHALPASTPIVPADTAFPIEIAVPDDLPPVAHAREHWLYGAVLGRQGKGRLGDGRWVHGGLRFGQGWGSGGLDQLYHREVLHQRGFMETLPAHRTLKDFHAALHAKCMSASAYHYWQLNSCVVRSHADAALRSPYCWLEHLDGGLEMKLCYILIFLGFEC